MALRKYNVLIKRIVLLTFFLNFILPTISLTIQDLGGIWNVKNAKKGYNFPATVPGGIYSDLMQNQIIGDIFYGFNDTNTRWVSKMDWNYSRSFIVKPNLFAYNNINLVFDGVDTFSNILINDVPIGITENMFLRYVFDIKPHLQLGKNTITVKFKSPVYVAASLYKKQAKNYVVPPKCVPKEYNGECHVNHIRKMQASFSWDWGPAFPSVGIWKKVYLEGYNSSVIRDVTINISSNALTNHWDINLRIYLEKNLPGTSIKGFLKVKLLTDVEKITTINKITVERNPNGEFILTNFLTVPKPYVQLWWPNGYGNPKLYKIKISFISPNKLERSVQKFRIGFRTVELVQNPVKSGKTFYFKINGVPIFAKGTNSIPISILPELGQNESTIRFLLQSAKDVHMNMIRVWGGGVYESEAYYELADEFGIMIWQDFMFACSMYPASKEFLDIVRNEIRHQVRRLQHHPSIVLWAGNNENEAALRQNWYNTVEDFELYKKDYIKLYVNTIKEEVLLNDNSRPYLTSSPTNGIQSDAEGYIAEDPQSHIYGDVHFYNYIADGWERSTYPTTRFVSEFGYQSMPSIDTWLTATNNISASIIDNEFFNSRQHHFMGYFEMQSLIGWQLNLPSESDKCFNKAYIFYSQIAQAMSIKIETEYYRQWRSHLNDADEGLTMGALYWQLNDVWVAPSWSSIDFKNNWKMLHYYAKHFFAPVIVTGTILAKKQLYVYIVSDLMKPIENAVVDINVFRWNSFVPEKKLRIKTKILPGISQKIIATQNFTKNNAANYFVYLTVTDNNNKTIAPDNFIFPIELKYAKLNIPVLEISKVTQVDDVGKKFAIEITTDEITLFVWLYTDNIAGRFSDNGFLQVTPTKVVYFNAEQRTTVKKLRQALYVTNLLDKIYL